MSASPSDDLGGLLDGLQGGDHQAAGVIVQRFAGSLTRVAAENLHRRVRAKESASDVVQSVFRTFFRRQADGDYVVVDWGSLWGLLAKITIRKCLNRNRFYLRQRRSVTAEAAEPDLVRQVLDREPTPAEAAELEEVAEQAKKDFDETDCKIVDLARLGYSRAEIASLVGCSVRTVYRVLEIVHQRLLRRLQDADGLE